MGSIRSVKGLVTMVTGGASGLGKATVQRLHAQGAKLLVCDLPQSEGAAVTKQLGDRALFMPADVTNSADVQAALDACKDKFGRLDALVNCAGTGVAFLTYNFNKKAAHKLEDFERVIRVNLLGTFNASRLAVHLIAENEPDSDKSRGCVIMTASVAAFDGQMGQVAYAASKAAIAGMTLPMARDLSKGGVRCVTIAPGLYDTPLLGDLPEKVRTYLGGLVVHPRRMGLPDEYAHTAQYILENPYVNAETIRVDGGLRMPP